MSEKIIPYPLGKKQSVDLIHDQQSEAIWANQKQMADMFDVMVPTIAEHIRHIEEESGEKPTIRKFLIVQNEGGREVSREVQFYDHRTVVKVGFRCHSEKAQKFQEWASRVIYHSLIKEERLHEQDAYRMLKGTLCRANDYKEDRDNTSEYFARMQNMVYYAVCGLSAAGIKLSRADHTKPDMGLQFYEGKTGPSQDDALNAKKYLARNELAYLQRIAQTFMLAIEMASEGFRPQTYTMNQMLEKLEGFLIHFGQLDEAGVPLSGISTKVADEHAKREQKLYKELNPYRKLMQRDLPKLRRGEKLDNPIEGYSDNVMRIKFSDDDSDFIPF